MNLINGSFSLRVCVRECIMLVLFGWFFLHFLRINFHFLFSILFYLILYFHVNKFKKFWYLSNSVCVCVCVLKVASENVFGKHSSVV